MRVEDLELNKTNLFYRIIQDNYFQDIKAKDSSEWSILKTIFCY
jgi:hypothetical protein